MSLHAESDRLPGATTERVSSYTLCFPRGAMSARGWSLKRYDVTGQPSNVTCRACQRLLRKRHTDDNRTGD
jgi:hypothetical protein